MSTGSGVRMARKYFLERMTSKLTPKGEEARLQVSVEGRGKRDKPGLSPRNMTN